MIVGSDCSFIFCLQAIDEHRSDAAALVGTAGFFFDDRRQRDQLLGRLHRHVGAAAIPDFGKHALLRLLHALDHLIPRGAARKFIGLGQHVPSRGISRTLPVKISLSDSRVTICSEVSPSGIVTACCTTLPSTIVPITSRRLPVLLECVFARLQFTTGL